ncbi:hypothetical protein BaRGS_00008137 [Batillaria attramentaria]|uniref:Uncharacterized protein n=1 Tax=Batillaria attramentaria TaxID=370345 RepID=A0ABD0LND8_9CAEN
MFTHGKKELCTMSPQATSSVLQNTLSPEGGTSVKRVHYLDKTRDINRLSMDPHPRPTSPTVSPSGPSWSSQHPRPGIGGLTVSAGEDAGSHTSGSTSDSGRGGSSEDDVHSHVGGAMTGDSG